MGDVSHCFICQVNLIILPNYYQNQIVIIRRCSKWCLTVKKKLKLLMFCKVRAEAHHVGLETNRIILMAKDANNIKK